MAEAEGSPASNSDGAAGDLVGPVVPNGYQVLLVSVGVPAPGAGNVGYHQQQFYNPAGMIHAPMPGQPASPPPRTAAAVDLCRSSP
jgi:hypothetical protein